MAYALRINDDAHEEYIQAYEWYELKQSGLGKKFMNCVEEKLQQIFESPDYYSKKQHFRFREAKVNNFPFMIVYDFFPRKKTIHVLAIYHTKRNNKAKYRNVKTR